MGTPPNPSTPAAPRQPLADHSTPELQGLGGTPGAPPLHPPQQLHRIQGGLGSPQETPPPLWAPFQGSATLTAQQFLLTFRWNSLGCSLCPLLLVLALGTTKQSPAPSPAPSLQISISTAQILSAFSLAGTQPGALSLLPSGGAPGPTAPQPSAGLSPAVPICLELGSPALGALLQMCPPRAEQMGGSPPSPCWPHSAVHCRVICAFLPTSTHCWPIVSLWSTSGRPLAITAPRSFSAELLPSSSAPNLRPRCDYSSQGAEPHTVPADPHQVPPRPALQAVPTATSAPPIPSTAGGSLPV